MSHSAATKAPTLARLAMPDDTFPNSGCAFRPRPGVVPWSASDAKSFAYESATKRWPTILGGVIDGVHKEITAIPLGAQADKVKEGKRIIEQIGALKYECARDKDLTPLDDDGGSGISLYNEELRRTVAASRGTWFTASWLFCECYLYRRLRTLFAMSTHWSDYDPFAKQKISTLRSSQDGVFSLAKSLQDLVEGKADVSSELSPEEVAEAAFLEMAQVALWGNATDLSLLTNLTHEDIQKLQRTGKAAQQEASESILQNELDDAYQHIRSLTDGRVDIVLDNAGFEVLCDCVFADWLTTCTTHVKTVVFHPKNIPWFVSDVISRDFTSTLEHLLDPGFFDSDSARLRDIHAMARRWHMHLETGRWALAMPSDAAIGESVGEVAGEFWTNPLPFWAIPERAPALLSELQKSDLVIFKGDLNYRKLTGDATWASTISFAEALGPLAGKLNILSLRTLKADVIVGLQQGTAEQLDRQDPRWRVNGHYAVCAFSKRTPNS